MENNPTFNLYVDSGMLYEIYLGLANLVEDAQTGQTTKTPIDLSDIVSLSGDIKKNYSSSASLVASFNVSIENATAGEILVTLPASASANIELGPDPTYLWGYYDIVATNNLGTKIKIVGGKVYLNQVLNK